MDQGVRASFYITDSRLTEAQLKELLDLASLSASRWYEFVVNQGLPDDYQKSRIYSSQSDSPADSIIKAGGKWIVIIPFSELKRHYDFLVDAFMRLRHGLAAAAVPASRSFAQKAGIRSLSATSFVAFRKYFITSTPYLDNVLTSPQSRLNLLKIADRQTALYFFRDTNLLATAGSVLPERKIFIRPYFKILLIMLKGSLRNLYIFAVKLPRRTRALYRRINVKKIVFDESIPVFITCRDRVSTLKIMVKWLEEEGLNNMIFIDNDSTYPPLLKYYEEQKDKYTVVRLRENAGHTAAWLSGAIQAYAANRPYILTDPDILPVKGSHGAVKYFINLLNKYPKYQKVGIGLKIDDLPDSYELKPTVLNWESQFWEKEIEKDVYIAEIDTTLALYRPNTYYLLSPALRTGGKFIARHEPWYLDSKNIDEEVMYYRAHADKTVGSWGVEGGDLSGVYEKNEDEIAHSSVQ